MLGGIGAGEIALILAIALIVFGPRKLPEIGRSFGKTLHEFRKASFSSFNDFENEMKEAEIKEEEAKKSAQTPKPEALAGAVIGAVMANTGESEPDSRPDSPQEGKE